VDIFRFDLLLGQKTSDGVTNVIEVNNVAIHNGVRNQVSVTDSYKLKVIFEWLEFDNLDRAGTDVNTDDGFGATESQ
jgi:predicted RecB family nuclease